MDDMLKKLELTIGYTFMHPQLLEEALTHRSFTNEVDGHASKDNQRLEFFGDSVINLLVSEMLLKHFPKSREGALSKIRASLVDEEGLASVASSIDLGACLRLGRGEVKSGGREKKSLLADAYEALVAAVYLDGGLDHARVLVEKHFYSTLVQCQEGAQKGDFKTDFQEIAQSYAGVSPRYQMSNVTGPDHNRIYKISVYVGNELMGEGSGKSKREAEQAAAREGIVKLRPLAIKSP